MLGYFLENIFEIWGRRNGEIVDFKLSRYFEEFFVSVSC